MPSQLDESLDRFILAGRLEDPLERDQALATTQALLFGATPAPVKFGRYLLLERIGAGGQGVVHAAYDPELDRRVAIKLLGTRGGLDRRADLLREAQAVARLAHPNVLAVHDVGVFDEPRTGAAHGRHQGIYMVTELVLGDTLQAWCAVRPRHWRDVLEVLRAAGRGLAAAHAGGLVHADFKPANVLIGHDPTGAHAMGRVRVVDFGIARLIGTPSTPESAGSSSTLGTPPYMAPEQHAGASELDPRADVFAFCVTAFEALYGQRPFVGRDHEELVTAKLRREIRVPGATRVPRWVHRIVVRGLAPDPADRHASMGALLDALDRDPGRRLRNVALASTVVLLVGASAIGVVRERAARRAACEDRERELAGVWDEPAREGLRAAFLAAEPQAAIEAWDRVARGLDAYAGQWVRLREASCHDTVIAEREPMSVMSTRMLCLDKRAARLGGLVRRLHEVDARTMTRAAQSVAELPPLEPCVRSSSANTPVAVAPREEILALEGELADVEALRHTDRFREAEAASDRALARAQALDDPAGLGRVWLQRGGLERWRGDFPAAETALARALHLGERADDDELAAGAIIELAFVVGVPRARALEGLRLADLAAAKLARVPASDDLLAQLAYHRGRIFEDLHRHDEAQTAFEQALRLAHALYGSEHGLVADVVNMLGVVEERRGHHAQALAHYELAYRTRVALVGEINARTAVALGNISGARWNLAETETAMTLQRRAITILERTLGPAHIDTSWARRRLAAQLMATEQPAQALIEAEHSLRAAEATGELEHPWVVESLVTVAAALRELGRASEARELGARAVRIARVVDEPSLLGDALVDHASSLRLTGACEAAGPVLAETIAIVSASDYAAAEAHAERGRCALAAGHADIAALELGHALGMVRGRGDGPADVLSILVDFARALAETSPVTASRPAREALEVIDRAKIRSSWRTELERLARAR